MLKIKVKTEGKTLSIPLPYTLLNVSSTVLCSKFLWRNINKRINKNSQTISILPLDPTILKPLLKQVIKELKDYKGLVIVDVKTDDGTRIWIQL